METSANREGIAFIAVRMEWYTEYSKLLLKENTVDGGSSAGLRLKLENHVVSLYKALLLYLMKSVCSYYRNRVLGFLRDTIKRDGWEADLEAIKNAEKDVQQDAAEYNTLQVRSHLEQLVGMQLDERLRQRLKDLPHVENAAFDSTGLEYVPPCQPGTRTKFLKLIRDWSTNPQDEPILWFSGWAGTGKSTIALTISREFSNMGFLGGSFFFSKIRGVTGASKFITTLAYQLAHRLPGAAGAINKAISDHPDISEKNKRDQWEYLIVQPLTQIAKGCQAARLP